MAAETRAERRRKKREALKYPSRRPEALRVQLATIPVAMREARRWFLWRYEWSEQRKEWAKVPRQVNGRTADPTKSSTWSDFATVARMYSESIQLPAGKKYSG